MKIKEILVYIAFRKDIEGKTIQNLLVYISYYSYYVLKEIVGEDKVVASKPRMGGEDHPHHNSKFVINEKVLKQDQNIL